MKRYYFIQEELRRTRDELAAYLHEGAEESPVLPFIRAEYDDVELAIKKLEAGNFGKCELSGELLPEGLLGMVPTARNTSDLNRMGEYLRKSLY
ncbi:hypothetical protein [Mesobacillus zeae]|uniref:Uncharacterized protein n=1 Tax=Mesobacillus zeae TaxID=1917180 RepID=A0A398BDN3_9BACI|nr:hypothetical protein [Mesobacillus zeae]RID87927.1 hypothetical protein D1970_03575 [Mesobacillus zeae]